MELEKLAGIDENDGSISLADQTGKKIWRIARPVMTDAEGNYSDQVELILRKIDGKDYLKITADPGFLTAPDTVYPVTIDPTINTWDVMSDTFVASSFPDTGYGDLDNMYAGNDQYYYGKMRSYVRFFLPALPSGSQISTASYNAYQTYEVTEIAQIELHQVTEDWQENITWNTQPASSTEVIATTSNNSYDEYWQWDISQLVKDWYQGNAANYGFMLKRSDETALWRRFNTVESGNYTPRLTINYQVDPIGTEDFWGYSQDGVNLSNGNLVFQTRDFNIPGRGVPVSLSRTYNSRQSGQII